MVVASLNIRRVFISTPLTAETRHLIAPGGAVAGIYMMIIGDQTFFFADCTVNIDPTGAGYKGDDLGRISQRNPSASTWRAIHSASSSSRSMHGCRPMISGA